jgi:hypothetical protein
MHISSQIDVMTRTFSLQNCELSIRLLLTNHVVSYSGDDDCGGGGGDGDSDGADDAITITIQLMLRKHIPYARHYPKHCLCWLI